jgi:hypothetical protein
MLFHCSKIREPDCEGQMDTNTLVIVAAIILLLVVGAIVYMTMQRRKQEELRDKFGPEYERTVEMYGDEKRAQEALAAREKRVKKLDIRPLTSDEYQRFSNAWNQVQARFVDDPSGAVNEGDRLVTELMQTRGYPMGDFEQRAADISVDHANVVTNYRAARDIAAANRNGSVSTEELRQALVHYRALFQDLLETQTETVKRSNDLREVTQ